MKQRRSYEIYAGLCSLLVVGAATLALSMPVESGVAMQPPPRIELLEDRLHNVIRDLAVLRERVKLSERAVELQASEYERRLAILNHEAEQLAAMQATYLPREVWEAKEREILREIAILREYKDQMIGRMSMVAAVVSVAVTILASLVHRYGLRPVTRRGL